MIRFRIWILPLAYQAIGYMVAEIVKTMTTSNLPMHHHAESLSPPWAGVAER
jgi:hypothetical protein